MVFACLNIEREAVAVIHAGAVYRSDFAHIEVLERYLTEDAMNVIAQKF